MQFHRAHLQALRCRTKLLIDGDVAQRGAPRGLFDDGWTNGALEFFAQPARNVGRFVVSGFVPEWWPPETMISIDLDGITVGEIPAVTGPFRVVCEAPIARGNLSKICVRTSKLACDAAHERDIGVYVEGARFESLEKSPFTCNICQYTVADFDPILDPEESVCLGCGSNIRQRAVANLLGIVLHGSTLAINEFPVNHQIVGVGVSDSPNFAQRVKRVVPNYVNTQFDASLVDGHATFLDVTRPPTDLVGAADFVTCSEVLEHVESPVQAAFDGLYSILRPGGALIFTVPYTLGRTVEHFSGLDDWRIERRAGQRVLVNRSVSGTVQEYTDLKFHGGGEAVLEMRVFGLEDLLGNLETAGFVDIAVREENVLPHGIFFKYNWALPITARRPE